MVLGVNIFTISASYFTDPLLWTSLFLCVAFLSPHEVTASHPNLASLAHVPFPFSRDISLFLPLLSIHVSAVEKRVSRKQIFLPLHVVPTYRIRIL